MPVENGFNKIEEL